MQITFLGTGCMIPTKERNHSAILLRYKQHGLLFDCGEGTQRQLRFAGIRPTVVNKIFISHWHGDHVLGIPGLVQSLQAMQPDKILEIYGPRGTKEFIKNMFNSFKFDFSLDLKVKEISEGTIIDLKEYKVEAFKLKHSIETFGFVFKEKERRKINLEEIAKFKLPIGPLLGKLQEGLTITWKGKTIRPEDVTYIVKGRKIVYVADTRPIENIIKYAKDADLMISEAVYISRNEKKAKEYMHMTVKEACELAKAAGVKKLVLTHFSQRYKDDKEIKEEAKNYFDNVIIAHDFMKLDIK